VSPVQGGDVLQQESQDEARVGAREQWRVRGVARVEIGPVQGGDVLQQEAQGEALVGAREQWCVRGDDVLQQEAQV